MVPVFYINQTDYAKYVLKINPVRNDLDKDGSGRNILDGYFFRTRVASKKKWKVDFVDLDEDEMASIAQALYPEYLTITFLDPKTNQYVESEYYTSTFDYGEQKLISASEHITIYQGASIELTER